MSIERIQSLVQGGEASGEQLKGEVGLYLFRQGLSESMAKEVADSISGKLDAAHPEKTQAALDNAASFVLGLRQEFDHVTYNNFESEDPAEMSPFQKEKSDQMTTQAATHYLGKLSLDQISETARLPEAPAEEKQGGLKKIFKSLMAREEKDPEAELQALKNKLPTGQAEAHAVRGAYEQCFKGLRDNEMPSEEAWDLTSRLDLAIPGQAARTAEASTHVEEMVQDIVDKRDRLAFGLREPSETLPASKDADLDPEVGQKMMDQRTLESFAKGLPSLSAKMGEGESTSAHLIVDMTGGQHAAAAHEGQHTEHSEAGGMRSS